VESSSRFAAVCPRCSSGATVVQVLAPPTPGAAAGKTQPTPVIALSALLDNVRSAFNVGSIFRSADGAGFCQLYLAGITPRPDEGKLAKTGLGAETQMAWRHVPDAVRLAEELIAAGHELWALETDGEQSLLALPGAAQFSVPHPPVVLVVGNELAGIDPDVRRQCRRSFHIPMRGRKQSLNVATAFGVAAVWLGSSLG
jgi:tRNA G18 (ribose-2'-O)-methylase SpoU